MTKKDQENFEKDGYDFNTHLLHDELLEALGDDRVRAIVKDLEVDNRGLDSKNIRKAFDRVHSLNEMKIYNRDVRAVNFKNCLLVDFGLSWTEPHKILEALGKDGIRETKLKYRKMYDQMIADEEIKTRFKAFPNPRYCAKLRSWGD